MDHKREYSLASVVNKQNTNPVQSNVSPEGEAALWGGPLSQVGRPHKPGNSAGADGMQVLKYPTPYQSKPITQCAKQGRHFEAYTRLS